MATPTRIILTGVPPYNQTNVVKENGKEVIAGCGAVAALMLMAWYDRVLGFRKLIPTADEAVTGMPNDVILELRREMHTVNDLKNGQQWGMTVPAFFISGIESYYGSRYGKTKVRHEGTAGIGVSIDDVFDKSVAMIRDGQPHCLSYDFQGTAGMFPNHYVVVVGFSQSGSTKKLVANPGWGRDFQEIDFTDKKLKPANLYWIDSIEKAADGPKDGRQIGPSTRYTWVDKGGGQTVLKPTLLKHFSQTDTVTWPEASESTAIIANTEVKRNCWFD